MRFKGSNGDPLAVARELDVRYVLDGSAFGAPARHASDRRLLDAADGSFRLQAGRIGQGRLRSDQGKLRLINGFAACEPHESREVAGVRSMFGRTNRISRAQAMDVRDAFAGPRSPAAAHRAQIVGENARLLAALGACRPPSKRRRLSASSTRRVRGSASKRIEGLVQSQLLRGSIHWGTAH
jgi:hypothetical protein